MEGEVGGGRLEAVHRTLARYAYNRHFLYKINYQKHIVILFLTYARSCT